MNKVVSMPSLSAPELIDDYNLNKDSDISDDLSGLLADAVEMSIRDDHPENVRYVFDVCPQLLFMPGVSGKTPYQFLRDQANNPSFSSFFNRLFDIAVERPWNIRLLDYYAIHKVLDTNPKSILKMIKAIKGTCRFVFGGFDHFVRYILSTSHRVHFAKFINGPENLLGGLRPFDEDLFKYMTWDGNAARSERNFNAL